jgi:hypothetical protein
LGRSSTAIAPGPLKIAALMSVSCIWAHSILEAVGIKRVRDD